MFKHEEYDADFNNGVMSRVGVARYDVLNVECVISLLICIIFRCVNVAFFHTKTCVKYSPLGNCRISFLSVHDYLSSSNLDKRIFLFIFFKRVFFRPNLLKLIFRALRARTIVKKSIVKP